MRLALWLHCWHWRCCCWQACVCGLDSQRVSSRKTHGRLQQVYRLARPPLHVVIPYDSACRYHIAALEYLMSTRRISAGCTSRRGTSTPSTGSGKWIYIVELAEAHWQKWEEWILSILMRQCELLTYRQSLRGIFGICRHARDWRLSNTRTASTRSSTPQIHCQ